MKKIHFIALSIAAMVNPSIATGLPICKSPLTKQMKRFEKIEFTIPRKAPSGMLKEYAAKLEILCPWQLEMDLNGDKQNDWVGIIHRKGQFELVAYLSANKKFSLQVLHQYQFFPEQNLLRIVRNQKFKKNVYGSIKYNLQEISFDSDSRVYSFEKGKMKVIKQYVEKIKKKENKKELEIRNKNEIKQLLQHRKRHPF
ncbi:MAG: hypothetical protein COB38_08130 [Gammaproteobacteria bacterium]|nr:MAG: hypothetical protein COB38_08130 [Gammaproteobacteria bacterium]